MHQCGAEYTTRTRRISTDYYVLDIGRIRFDNLVACGPAIIDIDEVRIGGSV